MLTTSLSSSPLTPTHSWLITNRNYHNLWNISSMSHTPGPSDCTGPSVWHCCVTMGPTPRAWNTSISIVDGCKYCHAIPVPLNRTSWSRHSPWTGRRVSLPWRLGRGRRQWKTCGRSAATSESMHAFMTVSQCGTWCSYVLKLLGSDSKGYRFECFFLSSW